MNTVIRCDCFTLLAKFFSHAVGLCFVVFMLPGCSRNPEIAKSEWDSIRVVYMVRDEDDHLKPKTWNSEDSEMLKKLQAAFPRRGELLLHSKPHLSRVNRMDIKLRGGQWWSLSYFPDSGNIGIADPNSTKRTFILKHSEAEVFYAVLTNEIMRASGLVVDLDTKIRSREEVERLGNNDAAWYMWNFQ